MRKMTYGGGDARGAQSREPVAVGELLRDLLRELKPTVQGDPPQSLERLHQIWTAAVGEELARLCHVIRYRGGVMTVEVNSAPLISELGGFARESLIEELAARGMEGVHDLRFKVGRAPSPQRGAEGG